MNRLPYKRIVLVLALLLVFQGVLATNVQADALGQKQTFYVNGLYDLYSRDSLSATLLTIGQHAYIYVDDRAWSDLSISARQELTNNSQELLQEFDTHIYPQEVQLFGSEPNPGVDNDPHLVILLEAVVPTNGGYFDTINEAPVGTTKSNSREMITLNVKALGTNLDKLFLAHEFQHLISYNQKEAINNVVEDTWLNEGRSEYTAELMNYNTPFANSNLSRRIQIFLDNPSDSLTEWPNTSIDYSQAVLFMEYMGGRYGSNLITETEQSAQTGISSINQFLSNHGIPDTFADIYRDWMITNYLNDPNNHKYSYANQDLQSIHIIPNNNANLSDGQRHQFALSVKDWQENWFEFTPPALTASQAVQISIGIDPAERAIGGAVIKFSDGSYQVQPLKEGQYNLFIGTLAGKTISRIGFVAATTTKLSGYATSEPMKNLTVQASVVPLDNARGTDSVIFPSALVDSMSLKDGALIKRNNGDPEIYVIEGHYKRYLSPEIIKLYGHLDPTKAIPVDDTTFNSYSSANYVRNVNDQKIYAVWPDNTKHWLHMSADTFTSSGRDWNAIFIINDSELAAYRTGVEIKQ